MQEEKRGEREKFIVLEGLACGFRQGLIPTEKNQLKDREELENKRANTSGNKFGQQKSNANRSSFQHKQEGPSPSSSSASAPSNKWVCQDASTSCFKCGQNGHFMRECPKSRQSNRSGANRTQSSSVAPPDLAASR
ncbi:hypothetical protein MTR67_042866 [Solanum verrucosum]|uniref:CCHC-type domain-containing protein n=1 Tax=Solanum verrucosum TaxID=315347 RepID=A0AAF0UQV7_SOLVR|nr:hypothetical protein MTR67_042866 [Solanum verrucosum]